MKLLESYSLNSGLKITKPFLYEKFLPIPFEKYITIHAGGGQGNFDSKLYSYYQEVINLIRPILTPLNYKIIQIGIDKDEQLQNIDLDLRGKTDIHQSAFLIKNCNLFLGNDSCNSHFAGFYGVPMVSLYGGTSAANHSPFWYSNKSIFLEPYRNGKNCSFSMQESPKTINMITPETVAQSILNLLEIKQKIELKTIFIGNNYKDTKLELIPDQVINPNFFNGIATIRGDYYFNEQNILQQLNLGKCVLVLSQPINIETLKLVKQNIALLLLKIDNFPDIINYIKQLRTNTINYAFITSIQDDEELKPYKLNLYEYGIIQKLPYVKKDSLEFLQNLNYNKTRLKTNTLLLSGQKVYASYAHYLIGESCELQNSESKLLDTQVFINEIHNFWIYTGE